MATPNDGFLGPIAALLQRRRRGARDTGPADDLHGILEAVPAAIVVQGPDGQVQTWNRAAGRLFGWAKLQAEASLPPFIPADAQLDEAALRRRVLAGNEVFRAPGRYLDAGGEALALLVSAAPRRDVAGKVVGVVTILEEPVGIGPMSVAPPSPVAETLSDTVPEAAPEPPAAGLPAADRHAMRNAPARVPAMDQTSRLLAKVSHDLRQPLHALSLLTGALERRVKEPSARELVEDAGAMVRALQTTFDNLVDLGKLDEGSVRAQPAIVPVSDVLAPLAAEFARDAQRRNIDLRLVGSSAAIYADAVLLQRLLRQVLVNALRFAARENGDKGKVLLGARRHGDRLRLTIADDGIGISRDAQATIFEPFVQSDAGRANGGLGLGLAIATRLARLLDANVGLQSEPGKGSRFWIDVALERRMDELI